MRSIFLGCYDYNGVDNTETETNIESLTVTYCLHRCRKNGFGLAAIRGGNKCGCSNKPIDPKTEIDKSECQDNCTGQKNSTGLCGGIGKWSIYVLTESSSPEPDTLS